MSTSAGQSLTSQEVDPSQTGVLRGRLAGRWRGTYGAINSQLETDVVTRDAFGTRTDGSREQLADVPSEPNTGQNYDPGELPALASASHSEQVRRFREWLDRQQEQGIRGRLSRQHNPYLVQAYATGVRRGEQALRKAGEPVDTLDPEDIAHRETTLDRSRSDFHDRLTKAFQDTTAEAGQALSDGLKAGLSATVLFERLRDRINHSRAGKTRSRPVAHSAIVSTANLAALDRYELAGVESVGAQVEVRVDGPQEGLPEGVSRDDVEPEDEPRASWVTAQDPRVCPQCSQLEGQQFRISDIRAGRAPLPGISTHGGCRCFYNKPVV